MRCRSPEEKDSSPRRRGDRGAGNGSAKSSNRCNHFPALLRGLCVSAVSHLCISAAYGAEAASEAALNDVPTAASLRVWHDLLGSAPHLAGTPGDRRVIESIADGFGRMGLEVQEQEFLAFLSRPREALLEIVEPLKLALPIVEAPITEDPASGHPDRAIGFNAYSGSGDVTAEVVYANYGTREDFARLRELGVDVAGRIVIARYGGNFRGYKAKFAEAAGAAGLIIYTDPDDSGYRKGILYPEGGWANEQSIQRGSLATLEYPGDPLTPFEPAVAAAQRLDPDAVALPRIPVQPVGWAAASEILSRMRGVAVPAGWQGGLPFAYRHTGGESLRVRLMVRQERGLVSSANVLGVLRGAVEPRRLVIVGCHHDAWCCGASDPLAGTIVLMECARSFADLASRGVEPARTIVFAAWGAEEHGIVGSVEWCEANRDELLRHGIAYVNLDMAAMGPRFGASSAPTLKRLIAAAAAGVPQSAAGGATTVLDVWAGGVGAVPVAAFAAPPFGDLGGGSDHIGFYCHLGIPSAGLGGEGASGTAYHSNYDTLGWYRKVVGESYEPALMVTRVTYLILSRLANDPLLPLELSRYGTDTAAHLVVLRQRAAAKGVKADFAGLAAAAGDYETAAKATMIRLHFAADAGSLDPAALATANDVLAGAERRWLSQQGLPGRPWFRSLYAASDPDSGYAPWMLPGLRFAVESGDPAGVAEAEARYIEVFRSLWHDLQRLDELVLRD